MSSKQPIGILTLDAHPIFQEGLSVIIRSQSDMCLVGQASCTGEGLRRFRELRPHITLLDLRLPGASRSSALSEIREEFPHSRVIALATSERDGEIQRAFRNGAAACALKSSVPEELLRLIREVHGGKRCVQTGVAALLAEHLGDGDLTGRELEVLASIVNGNRNKSIAALLGIAEATVNYHVKNIVAKLGANDRAHAVAIALRRGLIEG